MRVNEQTLNEQIAGARAYETLQVPTLLVLAAAGVTGGDRVLDVACAAGV